MTATVTHIYRHPLKGLSPESLDQVQLDVNRGLANDRRFALARASTRFDPGNPDWQPKTAFLMLMRDEKLAALGTRFDDAGAVLTVKRGGKQVVRGDLSTPVGRAMVEDFFAAYMKLGARDKPRVVEMPEGRQFSDHKDPVLSIINASSVKDLERVTKTEIDPRRFRGNLLITDLSPWEEFSWIGRKLRIGEATLEVTARIDRCAAINVDPETGVRDCNLVKALQAGFGHIDMGVYARITAGGQVKPGDHLTLFD